MFSLWHLERILVKGRGKFFMGNEGISVSLLEP